MRKRRREWGWRTLLGLCIALAAAPARAAAPPPGLSGGSLPAAMRRTGLEDVRRVPAPGEACLSGVLPGRSRQEIVLSARCGPAAGPSSGCGVVLAAVADLARTPRAHSLRAVLCAGLPGSQGWAESLAPERSERVLAHLEVGSVGWSKADPVLHILSARGEGPEGRDRIFTPGWLVHALLRSGEGVGWHYAVAEPRAPLLAQLVLRAARLRFETGAGPSLARGIPAVSLADGSLSEPGPASPKTGPPDRQRRERWSVAVAAAVRRLDALAGRPLPEDRYLVTLGRVWLRRDLYWAGLLLWALLVFRGRPRRRPGAPPQAGSGRRFLPSFAFRGLFLLAVLLAPVFSVLLYPAAVLALFPPRHARQKGIWIVLGALPLLLGLGALGLAFAAGLAYGYAGGWAAALLVPGALTIFAAMVWQPVPTARQELGS